MVKKNRCNEIVMWKTVTGEYEVGGKRFEKVKFI